MAYSVFSVEQRINASICIFSELIFYFSKVTYVAFKTFSNQKLKHTDPLIIPYYFC